MERLAQGTPFGRWVIEGWLSAGGMGDVYVVRDDVYGSPSALKVLRESLVSEAAWRSRFDTEALVGQRLKHPNIVAARELVVHQGAVGLIMDLVPGARTLARMIHSGHRGGLPVEVGLQLFLGVLQGVEYAHERDVVHGDLKPENILIDGDLRQPEGWVPRVCDFGTVALIAAPMGIDGRPAVVVSPRYASPEHLLGVDHLSPASDVFSLGLVLAFLLTGEHLSPARTVDEAAAWLAAPPGAVPLIDLPSGIVDLILRAIDRDAARRPASVRAFALDVRACQRALGLEPMFEDVGPDVATELVDRTEAGEGRTVVPEDAPTELVLLPAPVAPNMAPAPEVVAAPESANASTDPSPAGPSRRGAWVLGLVALALMFGFLLTNR